MLIDGEPVEARSGKRFDTTNPATGALIDIRASPAAAPQAALILNSVPLQSGAPNTSRQTPKGALPHWSRKAPRLPMLTGLLESIGLIVR